MCCCEASCGFPRDFKYKDLGLSSVSKMFITITITITMLQPKLEDYSVI